MNLFDKISIAPRIIVEKGWGFFAARQRHLSPFVTQKGDKIEDSSSIGEVFIYHKYHPQDLYGRKKDDFDNPNFEVGTVKALYIGKGKRLSHHFHIEKTEIFFLAKGELIIDFTFDGNVETVNMKEGDSLIIKPGLVHSMKGVEEENILIEVSTTDTPEDSYRIKRGD